jgi:ornithine carbamoyltransferase
MLTIKEHLGDWEGKKICFVGDGNNVSNSLLLIAPLLGMDMSVACPKGYEPCEDILKTALEYADENNTEITITDDIGLALQNVDAVFTDVWVSMGFEEERARRMEIFRPYQVTSQLFDKAKPEAKFLHCLPAHRGEEVAADVMDSSRSIVFDEAENRLHAQKALMALLIGNR